MAAFRKAVENEEERGHGIGKDEMERGLFCLGVGWGNIELANFFDEMWT